MTKLVLIEEEYEDSREKAYRFVAYTATVFSVVAILSTCLTLPMVNNYVSTLHERVNDVLLECRESVEGILDESETYQKAKVIVLDAEEESRNQTVLRRQARLSPPAGGSCSGCCLPGDPGPQGRPGKAGKPVSFVTI